MGRVGVDLYPLQIGVGLADVETFGKFLGGRATNVAVAAARHGRRSAGDHPHRCGSVRRVRAQAAHELGVDDRFVTPVEGLPTPVTFCEIFPPDHFPLYFYRFPKAPDLEIRRTNSTSTPSRRAGLLGDGHRAVQEPSRSAHHAAWAARQAAPLTVLDLDYRPMFWPSGRGARSGRCRPCRTSPSRSATSRSARSRSASGNRGRGQGPAGRRRRAGGRQAGAQGRPGDDPGRAGRGRRRHRSRSSTGSAPVTASAARSATACCPAGHSSG